MKTRRHYFISENLDDIDVLEAQLEDRGISAVQIHVLSDDDVGVANHIHLHEVQSLLRQDVIHSAQIGAVVGFFCALLILIVAYGFDLHQTNVGGLPYAFLAVVVFGFCVWEGGLFGIQEPNHHFRQFETALADGKHVLMIDVEESQEQILNETVRDRPGLVAYGKASGTSSFLIKAYNRIVQFVDRNLLSQSQLH